MPDVYAIRWTRQALDDIKQISAFISKTSEQNAYGFVEACSELPSLLLVLPERNHSFIEDGTVFYREFVPRHQNHLAFYTVEERTVVIRTILYGARESLTMLVSFSSD